jgi:hypothetical protein
VTMSSSIKTLATLSTKSPSIQTSVAPSATSLPPATSAKASTHTTKTGAIAGGIIGGFFGLGLLCFVLWLRYKRKPREPQNNHSARLDEIAEVKTGDTTRAYEIETAEMDTCRGDGEPRELGNTQVNRVQVQGSELGELGNTQVKKV